VVKLCAMTYDTFSGAKSARSRNTRAAGLCIVHVVYATSPALKTPRQLCVDGVGAAATRAITEIVRKLLAPPAPS